jgi:hypothetical protein
MGRSSLGASADGPSTLFTQLYSADGLSALCTRLYSADGVSGRDDLDYG